MKEGYHNVTKDRHLHQLLGSESNEWNWPGSANVLLPKARSTRIRVAIWLAQTSEEV